MAEFKLGDRVLVKWCFEECEWAPYEYIGVGQDGYIYFSGGTAVLPEEVTIIPLTENTVKYLGSTQDIPVPWEPKPGELVAVKDDDGPYWQVCVFIEKSDDGRFMCGYYSDMPYNKNFSNLWEQCEPLHKHFNVPKYTEEA